MTFTFASDFMLGAVASLILPTGVFICLAIWFGRSSRRFREPVSQPPVAAPAGRPGQMSAQSATAPPAQAPPAGQAPPPAQGPSPVQAPPPAQATPAHSQGTPAETAPDTPEPEVQ